MKRKTIITSVLVIVLCLGLISGSTFALFTSESKVNIAVTSGKVNIVASLDALKLYSADATLTEGDKVDKINPLDKTGTILPTDPQGAFAGVYRYKSMPVENNEGTFANGGTAAIVESTATTPQSLSIQKITPGDKVALDVKIANGSNVDIQYRVKVNVLSGLKLYEALVVKVDGLSLQGVQKVSNWTYVKAPTTTEAVIATIPVEVYLPLDVSDATLQDLSTSMQITVEAVQGNAKVSNEVLTQKVTAIAETATVVDSSTKQTTASTTISDNDNLVTVTIPASTTLTTENTTSLAVKVTPQDTVSNITVLSTQASASYDVSVLLVVNNAVSEQKAVDNVSNNKEITVSMYIGTGLNGVHLYHNENEIAYDSYNSETGYITFKTKSFSEYTVVYNADYAYETFDENGESTGVVVLEATEDTGVYVDKNENNEDVFVTVTEDETTGEAIVSTPEYVDVTDKDGVVFRKYANGKVSIYDMTNYKGTSYTVPENVTDLGGSSFSGNTTIKKLTFTKQINSASKAFDKNSTINEIDFGSMTTIPNRMFYGCTGSIKVIVIPSTVKRIDDFAFYGNTTIEYVFAKDVDYVGYKAFDACSSLKVLDIGGDDVQIMGWAGRQIASIETIIIRGENASVNLDYAPEGNSKGGFVFCKTQQSGNPNTMTGVDFYVANDTVASAFSAELQVEGATRKSIVSVSSQTKLNEALENGSLAVFADNIACEEKYDAPYKDRYYFVIQNKGGIIDGNGYTLSAIAAGDTYAIITYGGMIMNVTVDNAFRGIVTYTPEKDVILYNVVSGGEEGVCYALNTTEHGFVKIVAIHSQFNGWTSYAGLENVTFINCGFGQGNYYKDYYGRLVKPYVNTTFENCTFIQGYYLDLSELGSTQTVKFINCTANGKVITSSNMVNITTAEHKGKQANETETIFYELPSNRDLIACVEI